jgi:hypothetical protein
MSDEFKPLDKVQVEWFDAHPEGPFQFSRDGVILNPDLSELSGEPFATSWTRQVGRPFLTQNADGSITFNRPAGDAGEEELYQRIMARSFLDLYRSDCGYHYTYNSQTTEYLRIDRPMNLDDVMRHLRGIQPGLLGVPIELKDGKFVSYFGVIDADRHKETDATIEHAELAQLVTEYHLPLIVYRSKRPKGAHLAAFWSDTAGFSSDLTVQLLKKWTRVLGIEGEVEYFPAQMEVEEGKFANGVNLPYHGNERTALGRDGETLSLPEFLVLAHQRRRYGVICAQRDLGEPQQELYNPKTRGEKKYGAMTKEMAQSMFKEKLGKLRESNHQGHWNDILNETAFFASMAQGALDFTEEKIKEEIFNAASPVDGAQEKKFNDTFDSGWKGGVKSPLTIVEIAPSATIAKPDMPENCLDGVLGRVCRGRLSEFPLAYSWPSVLCSAGVLVKPHPKIRVNLYECLVGPIHSGKSQAQSRAHYLFNLKELGLWEELKSGSAEGLLQEVGDRQGKPFLWFPDELSHTMEKAQIEHSAFPFVLNSLFYNDTQVLTVAQRKKIVFNARMSIEGGVVEEKFSDSFGAAAIGGMYDRFLFSLCPSDFNYKYRPMEGAPLFRLKARDDGTYVPVNDEGDRVLIINTPEIDSSVWDARDAIQDSEGLEPRVLEIAIRCACICGAWDRKEILRASDMTPHWELARYMQRVRAVLRPNPGRSPEAVVADKIMSFLKRQADHAKWVSWRECYRVTRIIEYGPSIAERALNAMVYAGDIEKTDVKVKGGGRGRLVVRLAPEE